MQFQTMEQMPLLDRKGRLTQPSWATEDVFHYNKQELRPHFRRKEWEFYQLSNEKILLQLTYGHIGYAGTVGATLVDFETGERFSTAPLKLFPGDSLDLDFSPGQPHSLKYEDDKLFLSVHTDGKYRRLDCRSEHLDVKLLCSNAGDAICMATPFRNRNQFCYNYKKNFLDLRGYVRLRGRELELDENTFLLLNSGRGIWPYRHEWVWGNGTRRIGRHTLGINIGWGLGSDEAATENVLFWDGKAHKLDRIWVDRNQNPMEPWRFQSNDRRFDLRFEPSFDNVTRRNYLLVNTCCHQVFGKLYGTVYLDDGRGIKVDGMHFFCEHAENRW